VKSVFGINETLETLSYFFFSWLLVVFKLFNLIFNQLEVDVQSCCLSCTLKMTNFKNYLGLKRTKVSTPLLDWRAEKKPPVAVNIFKSSNYLRPLV
jgi:hypothetical protein